MQNAHFAYTYLLRNRSLSPPRRLVSTCNSVVNDLFRSASVTVPCAMLDVAQLLSDLRTCAHHDVRVLQSWASRRSLNKHHMHGGECSHAGLGAHELFRVRLICDQDGTLGGRVRVSSVSSAPRSHC